MAEAIHSWEFVGEIAISLTTTGSLPDREWDAFINDLKVKKVSGYLAANIGVLEVNSLQRKKFADLSKVKPFPVAVVTNERVVRGLVTAVSWLGVNIKSFAWSELQAATSYLGASHAEKTKISESLKSMLRKAKVPVDLDSLTGR